MIQELKQEVQESRKENTDLVEQIACLRQTLVDQIQPEELESSRNIQRKQWASEMREEIAENIRSAILSETQEEREMESNLLREKFKKVFKENASLQRRIDELENEAASVLSKNDACENAGWCRGGWLEQNFPNAPLPWNVHRSYQCGYFGVPLSQH